MRVLLAVLVLLSVVYTAESACSRARGEVRKQLLRLHKRAARCGDTDTDCIDRIFKKIHNIRRRLTSMRGSKCGGVRVKARTCKRRSFRNFMADRRARINRIARKCGSEDDSCVSAALQLMIDLNTNVRAQRRVWKRSCASSRKSRKSRRSRRVRVTRKVQRVRRSTEESASIWAQAKSWTHEFLCSRIRHGFKRWLAFQIKRRASFHAESAACHPSDLPCLRMNYQAIIRIQRKIRNGRNLYADRISRCDECAPLKLKWSRWLQRQRVRRHRLQLEACRCRESNPTCMQKRVDRIKKIQLAIRARRAQVLALNHKCQTSKDPNAQVDADDLHDLWKKERK